MINAQSDPTLIMCNIVDTVRVHLSEFWYDEVVSKSSNGSETLSPLSPIIRVIANLFFLFRVD